jgi:hypothetical protein
MSRMSTNNSKIIVDDYETKVKLKELADHTGKSMKAIIQRLVYLEHTTTFFDQSSLYPNNFLNLNYEFEPTGEGNYQVRLQGEFIAYTNHTDEHQIDKYLKSEGFNSRQEFLNHCYEEFHKEDE